TLTLALAITSIAVTCAQLSAEIRVEAAGLPTTQLTSCPQQKPLPCENFFQYKVFSHFSNLTLGDARNAHRKHNPNFVTLPSSHKAEAPLQTIQSVGTSKTAKAWNRLSIRVNSRNAPLDSFKSSSQPHASTGTTLVSCPAWNPAQQGKHPIISIEGNTKNPSGMIILCVDFIPTPPQPTGSLSITRSGIRNGEKAPLAWHINR
ncbi:MAG: hypothetical protein N2F24_01525, partial [Deltaproteobacteria bacterium]